MGQQTRGQRDWSSMVGLWREESEEIRVSRALRSHNLWAHVVSLEALGFLSEKNGAMRQISAEE